MLEKRVQAGFENALIIFYLVILVLLINLIIFIVVQQLDRGVMIQKEVKILGTAGGQTCAD